MKKRGKPERGERRRQILQATLSIMKERGLEGTTTRRIAERVGITEPALYRHFRSKKEIILEALDELGRLPLQALLAVGGEEGTVPERILRMSEAFYGFVMDNPDDALLLFEVMTAARDPDIREALGERFLDYILVISEMFEMGKQEGSVREDLNTLVAAWQILALAVTLVHAALMGLGDVLTRDKALLAVREILRNIVGDAALRSKTAVTERSGEA
ncbi:TetR/AcrR family transcriptional regulator [Candidatus Solincola tengchongensis]|uniref:TetR/AcrR family transcriptional regulator n=1 Tax=Candidatus Solincola tengchongensis TaxID=2900693 RepID=UPI00257CF76E|nr:TetR/AcrR family transcriptional regulator [Candidatus Solincola tengchongensis]